MMSSDEKEEMFDDWEDDEGFPSDGTDTGGFEEDSPQQPLPAKKKRGGGVLLFLLILLGGAGGGFYFLTTPGGAPYRDYLPEAVRGFLPAAEAPKPKIAGAPDNQQVADVLDGDIKSGGTQDTADTVDSLGFQAPPMPSYSGAEDMASADDGGEEVANFASFGGATTDDASEDTSDTEAGEDAWESGTPSEDGATSLSFDSAADTGTSVADGAPAPLAFDTADNKTETSESLSGGWEKQPEDNVSSFSATENQESAVKTEQLIDLEDRMSVLEKAVSGLEKNIVSKKDMSALQGDVSSLQADIRGLRSELKKAASVSRNTAPAPKAVPSASIATAKPAVAAKPTPKREWVMVSAQPGTAWISEKGSTGKREVSVGDTVPGLGRITSISPHDNTGRWVVTGTSGVLHQ